MQQPRTISLALVAIACIALGGCTDKRGDCAWTGTCPGDDAAGAAGDTGNQGGSAGAAKGGKGGAGTGATAGAGTGGVATSVSSGGQSGGGNALAGTRAAGTAGNGAAGNGASGNSAAVSGTSGTGTAGSSSIPCDGTCSGATPYCDESNNTCVACTKDTNCTGATPACDTETNVCVPCTGDKYCPSALPACNANKTCVACTTNPHCSGTKPACDVSTNTCVQCITNGDCANVTGRTVCDTARNTCVECMSSATCTTAGKPQCNTDTKACVACLSNADCKTAGASKCDLTEGSSTLNTCTPCSADADCAQVTGKSVCLTGVTGQPNQCVQCTGKKYAACGQSSGKALVCDSLAHSCSNTATAQSAGLCKTCISDAQCGAGQLCALETFNSSTVGYFCFWKQGDTANGAPAACFTETNRPYVNVQTSAVSIDNETATLCTLRAVTTCPALNQYSSTNCASATSTPNDALCGFAPGVDSKCAETSAGSGTFLCTTVCLSNFDCRIGATCNTSVTPAVCNL